MTRTTAVTVWICLLLCGPVAQAESRRTPARHCLGEGGQTLSISQGLGAQLEPSGILHVLQFAYCRPLITRPGLLYDYTHLELGLFNYLAPTFSHYGVFVAVSPLSILKIRAESSFVHQWTIPRDGKGYFPLPSYDADFSDGRLKSALGKNASGINAKLTVTLQAKVKLAGRVSLLTKADLALDYWWMDQPTFYKNQRLDLVLQRSDLALTASAVVLIEVMLSRTMSLAAGPTDVVSHVPRDPYTANLVGGVILFQIGRLGRIVRNLRLFARLGAYTHHANRRHQFTGVFGAALTYELRRF